MSRVVVESRAYDARFDPVYTSSNQGIISSDSRVVAAASSSDVVSGQARYKYFRRPVMPRISAIPPTVLLAPTATLDPLVPVEEVPEPAVKDAGMQTMYRESEAQTTPYTPAYTVPDGSAPEILLLKGLTYENGLTIGKKEIEMIEHARAKRELETSLPPFTDEASMLLRKKLMENQEMKEFRLRESEIDAKREAKMVQLERALRDRDESNEFLATQRVESIRQTRMEEREKTLQKIRTKRIKVLRRLALRRNQLDPHLSSSGPNDIISAYYDKASDVYAPVKRTGKHLDSDLSKFNVLSRTAPLTNMNAIESLEETIPNRLLAVPAANSDNPLSPQKILSSSLGAGSGPFGEKKGGGRAAQPRLTSAAQRALRHQKRDVEEMARILAKQKLGERNQQSRAATSSAAAGPLTGSHTAGSETGQLGGFTPHEAREERQSRGGSSSLVNRRIKGRPPSPDFTKSDRDEPENVSLSIACILLQRLLRGRAVQNAMYEGRYRRKELITELRSADEAQDMLQSEADNKARRHEQYNEQLRLLASSDEDAGTQQYRPDSKTLAELSELKTQRFNLLRDSTIDAAAGSTVSNLLFGLVQEQKRVGLVEKMHTIAQSAMQEKVLRETVEAGRRQRENMAAPTVPEESLTLKPTEVKRDENRHDAPDGGAYAFAEAAGIARIWSITPEVTDIVNQMVQSVLMKFVQSPVPNSERDLDLDTDDGSSISERQ